MTVEDHDAGSQPANAEQHPVEGDVYRVLAEIVDCGGDEISLVGVSVVAKQRGQAEQTGGAPDGEDQQFQFPLPGTLVAWQRTEQMTGPR